jgi:excisionase family DNA binding protein
MIDLSQSTLDQLADIIAERVAAKLAERAERRFLSREEFAQVHGLGMRTVDRAIAEGRLQVERSGRRVLIPSNAKIHAAN